MSGFKGRDLLMADKVANSDEKSVAALDNCPSYNEPAEESAGQENVVELNRGLFYFNDCYLYGYSENRDLTGSCIGRQRVQVGTNYWFGEGNRWQFNFPRRKVNHQHIQGGGTLMDAGGRGHYCVRSNLGLVASVQYGRWLFPLIQLKTQRNVTPTVEILFQLESPIHRSRTSATGSASGNGGRP